MIGCKIQKKPIIALYFESENELKFYNVKAEMKELHNIFYIVLVSLHILLYASEINDLGHNVFHLCACMYDCVHQILAMVHVSCLAS